MSSVERVLIVAPEFLPSLGGMQIHSFKTAEILANNGIMVEVLTLASSKRLEITPAFTIHRVLTRDFSRSLRLITGAANRFGAQVILLMNAGYSPLAALRGSNLPPIVVRTAGNDAYAPWHGPRLPLRFLAWRLPHRRPGSLGARLRRADQELRTKTVIAALGHCDRVLCNSTYSLSRLRSLGVPEPKLHVMSGGVDVEHFAPARSRGRPLAGSRSPIIIGIAGHLLPIKGIDVALNAFAQMRSVSPAPMLRIAGIGPEEPRLRALANRLGIASRVQFVGEISYFAMPEFYRSLDIYLQPSREIRHATSGLYLAESMGRALCEAQACGIPVVASRSGGIPDVVDDGTTGILVPPEDPGALAEALTTLSLSPATRSAMGAAGTALSRDKFSWESVTSRTLCHLHEVLPRTTLES